MNIALTGATGFLGRYIANQMTGAGHRLRCWFRPESDRGGFDHPDAIEWVSGSLEDANSAAPLVESVDAVIHAALHRPGRRFRGGEGDLVQFAELNVVGTIRLIEAARRSGAPRFIFISTCAVHELILDDRPLDEAHPMWPNSHYGAHKAAIEEFIHAYGFGDGYEICSLRPTGIYGVARPVTRSKWFDLVRDVKEGKPVQSAHGGKEVHASDVARAVEILLTAPGVAGQAYNCYDMYIAHQDVAEIAVQLTGSGSTVERLNHGPKHQIRTDKLCALGMEFGGRPRLEKTVAELIAAV